MLIFAERRYLTSASGFQSLQFRLLENKLGVIPKNRVSYNYQHYREVFANEQDRLLVARSEEEPSLFVLLDVKYFYLLISNSMPALVVTYAGHL